MCVGKVLGLRFLMFLLTLDVDASTFCRHAHVGISHGMGIEFGPQGVVLKFMSADFEIGLFSIVVLTQLPPQSEKMQFFFALPCLAAIRSVK